MLYLFDINTPLKREPTGDAQEAIVVFETDSAAKTALLLTNALIVDRPITVVPHVPAEAEAQDTTATPVEVPPEDITNRSFTAPDHERVRTRWGVSFVIF